MGSSAPLPSSQALDNRIACAGVCVIDFAVVSRLSSSTASALGRRTENYRDTRRAGSRPLDPLKVQLRAGINVRILSI